MPLQDIDNRYRAEMAATALNDLTVNTRHDGFYYLLGLSVIVFWVQEIRFSDLPVLFCLISLCLLAVLREIARRRTLTAATTLITPLPIYTFCTLMSAVCWIILTTYTLASVEYLHGGATAAAASTAVLCASTVSTQAPYYRVIKAYLFIMLIIPASLVPFVLTGNERWFVCLLYLIFFSFLLRLGKVQSDAYWKSVKTNISLHLKTEELKQVSQQAIQASEAKSKFLANISHEIRTPMNGILGIAELLEQTGLDSHQQQYLTIIRDSGATLLSIINDVLDFSKLEANKIHFHYEKTDIRTLLEGVYSLFSLQIQGGPVSFSLLIEDEVPDCVIADAQRIRQVLYNLISNAIKFTRQGSIVLHLSLTVNAKNQPQLCFSVQDTGSGIDEKQQEKVFTEFEQCEKNPTVKGTGLGLAISRRLVERMQGAIYFRSCKDQGSTFWFTLPLHACPAEQRQEIRKKSQQYADLQGLRVLVAEDDRVNQMVVSSFLQRWGCSVSMAANGHEALSLFSQESFDLILMDCSMPELDGFAATRLIREQEQKNQKQPIPVIALTAHVLDAAQQQCFDAGMNDYLSKPVVSQLLFDKLLHWRQHSAE